MALCNFCDTFRNLQRLNSVFIVVGSDLMINKEISDLSSLVFYIYRVSQEECARLREGFPYVKVYRYNPKYLCPNLNGYGDNGQRSLKF